MSDQLEKLRKALAASKARYSADERFIDCIIRALNAFPKGRTSDYTEGAQFALLGHRSRDGEVAKKDAEIAALHAEKAELVEALKPFSFIANCEEKADSGSSVMVNINRCRDARNLLARLEAL